MIELLRCTFQGMIDGFKLGWWKMRHDGLERAILFVRQGIFFERKLATRLFVGDIGEVFVYGDDGIAFAMRGKLTREIIEKEMSDQTKAQAVRWRKVYEPQEYYLYEDERALWVVDGEVVTSPVKGTGQGIDDASLSHFIRGNAIWQATHSFRVFGKGFGAGGLKLILGILALGVILFLVYHYVISPHLLHTVVTPTPTPTPTPNPFPTPFFSSLLWLVNML